MQKGVGVVSLHEVHSGIGIVSAVVSTIAGGIGIVSWAQKKKPIPDFSADMARDLAILERSDFYGWIDHYTIPDDQGGGYVIDVYLEAEDESVDRVSIREPGDWRAAALAELLEKTGIDLGI